MKEYGLIGYPLSHSFSRKYFTEKFARLGLSDHQYSLFELPDLSQFEVWRKAHPDLAGFNVTIPHKKRILPYLDRLSEEAEKIGAVNTVVCLPRGQLKGFNTDVEGFEITLNHLGFEPSEPALVLGNGGAAATVAYVLEKYAIAHTLVTRAELLQVDAKEVDRHKLIINCTPCGSWPDTGVSPLKAWEALGPWHRVIDLIYNPPQSLLLQQAASRGAQTCNGQMMLEAQAEAAWTLWCKPFGV